MEEHKIPEKFLPVGTVVLLKGGKRPIMINCCCMAPTGDVYDKAGKVENPAKLLDYGGCFYPERMVYSNQLFGFNHDMIDKILYMGYKTPEHEEFSNRLNQGIEELKKKTEEINKTSE